MISSRITAIVLAAAMAAGVADAQPMTRLATTIAALRAWPVFYHGRQVAFLGSVTESRGLYRLDAPAETVATTSQAGGGLYVFWRERPSRTSGEIRGEYWDLGRIEEGDSRFSAYDFRPILEAHTQGRWPGRDQIFVIVNASLADAVVPEAASLRGIAMAPEKFENRSVTVSGRFRGRNLYADLAGPAGVPTKWDFIIHSADASVWVTNLRPKGSGFDLDPGARVDTGRWLQVTGMVRTQGPRVWIEAREVGLSAAPEETTVEVEVPPTPAEPPPAVVFTTPVPDEADVERSAVLRVQFSRDMDARSFKGQIRITYVPAPGTPSPDKPAASAPPTWSFAYNVGNRGIEIKFAKPLDAFQAVKVELLEGVKAIDGEPLRPWSLTFTTGR